MFFHRRLATTSVTPRRQTGAQIAPAEPPTLAPPPTSPWSDGLGRMAIRSAQVLLLLAAAALVATVMVRLRLVVVPILIATLLAAAISPLVSLLVRRGLPRQLAVWVALIGGFAALAGVGWIVVAGIRAEWDELQSRATEGLTEVQEYREPFRTPPPVRAL